jgi:hypothetical protein
MNRAMRMIARLIALLVLAIYGGVEFTLYSFRFGAGRR